ncbi:MAG: HAD family phosphatase [Erysipelotrichaceae bacterium]|nr:HAD family phosphatase [Erysipelotrichaceae bacterium]
MRKICFFDVDGTIMDLEGGLTQENIEAIRALRKQGHKVFICTGRAYPSIFAQVLEIGWDGVICSAGGYVFVGDELIFENSIPSELVHKFTDLFLERNILVGLEAKDKYYDTEGFLDFYEKQYHKQKDDRSRRGRKHVSEYDGSESIAKINFISYDKEALFEVLKEAEQYFKIVFYNDLSGDVFNGELIPHECTKAEGVRQVVSYLHADMKDTVAFGDSMNDYEMLQITEHSYVSVLAPQCLKDIAQGEFDVPENSGISKLLQQLSLFNFVK